MGLLYLYAYVRVNYIYGRNGEIIYIIYMMKCTSGGILHMYIYILYHTADSSTLLSMRTFVFFIILSFN